MRGDEVHVAAVFAKLKWLFGRLEAVGRFITRQINFLLIGLTYLIAVVPLGLFLRLLGHELIDLRSGSTGESHWLLKESTSAELERFRRQF